MSFCPECGKSVGSTQKFCRSCGASLLEESPSANAPPAAAPAAPLTCRSCGSTLAPDEKFCGVCGTKSGGAPAPAAPVAPSPAPAPAAVPAPAPAPVPPPVIVPAPVAPQPPALQCPSCGTPMTPEMKFCGSCGSLAKSPGYAAPAAPAVNTPPPPPPPPAYCPPPVQPIRSPRLPCMREPDQTGRQVLQQMPGKSTGYARHRPLQHTRHPRPRRLPPLLPRHPRPPPLLATRRLPGNPAPEPAVRAGTRSNRETSSAANAW